MPITLPKTSTCQGEASLWSSHANLPGPRHQPFSFEASFTDGSGAWQIDKFAPMLMPNIPSPFGVVDLAVNLVPTATGTWDPVTGALSLAAELEFDFDSLVIPASTLEISLSTDANLPGPPNAVRGQRLNAADGAVVLAGIGVFIGGPLNGVKCAIQLQGVFTPNIAGPMSPR